MHSSNAVCSLQVICIDIVENKQWIIFKCEQLHFFIRILRNLLTLMKIWHIQMREPVLET